VKLNNKILLVIFIFALFSQNCSWESDTEYIRRHTNINFPPNGIKEIALMNNLENYVTGIFILDEKSENYFIRKNKSKNIDCDLIQFSSGLFDKKYHKYIFSNENKMYCYGSKGSKNWKIKLVEDGYLFIEIWY